MGTLLTIVGILAVIFAPIITLVISSILQDQKDKRYQKIEIFKLLTADRHDLVNENTVRALNLIDVVFSDHKDVTHLWREYYEMQTNTGFNNENGNKLREEKYKELIHAMATILGYKNYHLDISRVYNPSGLATQKFLNNSILLELHKLLSNSEKVNINITPIGIAQSIIENKKENHKDSVSIAGEPNGNGVKEKEG